MIRVPLLALVLALAACSSPTELPPNALPFEPPALYAQWWVEVSACTGTDRPFEEIEWSGVPGGPWQVHGYWAIGQYVPPRSIYLADHLLADQRVVKHEMIHAQGFRHEVGLAISEMPEPFRTCGRAR